MKYFWEQLVSAVRDLKRVRQEYRYFRKKVEKVLGAAKLGSVENGIDDLLMDLHDFVVLEAFEKNRFWVNGFQTRMDILAGKYGIGSIPEAKAHLVMEINRCCNYSNIPEVKWLRVKEAFLKYQAKYYKEITQLKKLDIDARYLEAYNLSREIKRVIENLQAEAECLKKEVEGFKPEEYDHAEMSYEEKYQFLIETIEKTIELYSEEGRSELLVAYNQFARECGTDYEKIRKGILFANEHLENEQQDGLKRMLFSAREQRKKKINLEHNNLVMSRF